MDIDLIRLIRIEKEVQDLKLKLEKGFNFETIELKEIVKDILRK